MSARKQQRHFVPWSREEVERLVEWMEANQAALRGKQLAWHKKVKEQVFAAEEHITLKKITDKATNMKRAWKEAKSMQERSGWGTTAEENAQSINDALEKKCTFFWRLDLIWGSRPKATVIPSRGSTSQMLTPAPPKALPAASPTAPAASVSESRHSQSNSRSPTPDSDKELDWPSSPPLEPTPAISARPSPALRPAPIAKRERHDVFRSIKRILEEKQASKERQITKRLKAEMDLHKERMEAEIRSAERVAQIQADAQLKQIEMFARIMETMLHALRPTSAPTPTSTSGPSFAPTPNPGSAPTTMPTSDTPSTSSNL